MKKAHFISTAMIASLIALGISALNNFSVAAGRSGQPQRHPSPSALQFQKPIRYTFRLFKATAQSLAYLPAMERVIVETSPERISRLQALQASEVRLTGIGDLTIGMTLEEAADALGLPLILLGTNLSGECSYYQPDTASQSLGLMVVDNRVIRIDIWPGSSLKTASGVAIGSSEAEVMQQYPGQIAASPNFYTGGKYLTFMPKAPELSLFRLVFETDRTGTVVQYRTGQFPAVTWADGCV